MKTTFLTLLMVFFTSLIFSQYRNRDGNRIGISAGISQATLFTKNFDTKPEIGFAGGLSVRGNYYNNWSMIYGMQFFINNFSIATTTPLAQQKDTKYSLSGVQVRLLLSYNVIQDHVSIDFGPVLQISDKLQIDDADNNNVINGTLLKADQILDTSKINGNFYLGFSAGGKVVRFVGFYEYGFTNVLGKLNSQDGLTLLNGNDKFKGNIGTLNGQIIFNF
jgi:hypothetical protein